jgi:hypothetical protein
MSKRAHRLGYITAPYGVLLPPQLKRGDRLSFRASISGSLAKVEDRFLPPSLPWSSEWHRFGV